MSQGLLQHIEFKVSFLVDATNSRTLLVDTTSRRTCVVEAPIKRPYFFVDATNTGIQLLVDATNTRSIFWMQLTHYLGYTEDIMDTSSKRT